MFGFMGNLIWRAGGKFLLRNIVGEVFKAESLGPGTGKEKNVLAVSNVTAALAQNATFLDKLPYLIPLVKPAVDAVVDLLNSIGLLDDEPGLDVDVTHLIASSGALLSIMKEIADVLSD